MSAQHDWERRETPEGTPYWVNHTTQTTQWEAPPPPPYSAAPHAQPVAAVAAGPPPVVVQAQPVAQPAAVPVVSSTVVAPPARPAQPAVTSSSSGNVAYQPPRGPPVATPAEPQKRGSMSAFFSRTCTLTKTAVVGKMAPKRLKKAGVLTLDGHARFVKLADGTVTIYESADADKADEKLVIFRAPIQYIKVKGYDPKNTAAPTEIRLFVEPEALNQEMNSANACGMGMGWHPMNLRVGRQAKESGYTGDVKRQNFSLFGKDKTEKHAWYTTLNTVCNSAREWAYVKHEVKDTGAYLSGKKK